MGQAPDPQSTPFLQKAVTVELNSMTGQLRDDIEGLSAPGEHLKLSLKPRVGRK